MFRLAPLVTLVCFLLGAAPVPPPVDGELRTEHFTVRFTARARGTAQELSTRLESVRSDFEALLGEPWPGKTEVRIGVGRAEFEALAPEGKPPAWAAGIAFPEHHVVVLEATELLGPGGELTLRHELCHAALGEQGHSWPRWFHEGLAMRLTGDTLAVSQYTALFRAVTQDRVFHFDDLARSWPEQSSDVEIAYAQSASFVGFLADRHGPVRFHQLLENVRRGDPFERAFGKAFHSPLDIEERDWRQGLPSRYSWLPILTGEAMIWFLVSCGCVAAYARRRAGRAAWRAEQNALEAKELAALNPDGSPVIDPWWQDSLPDDPEPPLH